jgi:hypothetical protein
MGLNIFKIYEHLFKMLVPYYCEQAHVLSYEIVFSRKNQLLVRRRIWHYFCVNNLSAPGLVSAVAILTRTSKYSSVTHVLLHDLYFTHYAKRYWKRHALPNSDEINIACFLIPDRVN